MDNGVKCWAFFEGRYLLISRFVGHDCRIRKAAGTKGRIDAGPPNLEACSVSHNRLSAERQPWTPGPLYSARTITHFYTAPLHFKSLAAIGSLSGLKSQRKCLVELSGAFSRHWTKRLHVKLSLGKRLSHHSTVPYLWELDTDRFLYLYLILKITYIMLHLKPSIVV